MLKIYSRHCHQSEISRHKVRPIWFSRERCFENLLDTEWKAHPDTVLSIQFDGSEEDLSNSYVRKIYSQKVDRQEYRSESKYFVHLLYEIRDTLSDDDFVYFCEDDYLHRGDWIKILKEGFSTGADIVSLYDHADKYDHRVYRRLNTEISVTDSCHWRTTPSTCHTFGVRVKCIKDHMNIWVKYSLGNKSSMDHEKFLELQRTGCKLISSIPGYATHVQPPWLSPTIDWKKLNDLNR